MNAIKRLLCWAYGVDAAELDKLAAAKHRDTPWSDWAKRISGRS